MVEISPHHVNLGQMQTVVCQLGGDKVLGDLDAVVKVPHLMAGAARNEHGVSLALDDRVAFHAILGVKTHTKAGVQVGALVVDRVVVWVQTSSLLDRHPVEQIPDLVGVPRVIDVPDRPWQLPFVPHSPSHDDVAASFVDLTENQLDVLLLLAVPRDPHVHHQVDRITHV